MKASEFVVEKKKRKRRPRWAAYGPGPYGGYGYATGYSGDSGSEGGDGGGESIKHEASYPGNIGMMELAKFFSMADAEQKTLFKQLLERGKKGLAWKLVQDIVGVKLQGSEFAEGSLEELANTSLKVKEPKDFVNVNDRKQVTYKVMKFKSGKDTYLIMFTVKGAPAFGKKQNWNAVNVAFGIKEKQDDWSFGDEIDTDLTAKNKNQFLIYSTVINAVRKFITEYNTEIDEIIMQGAGERQEAMYRRFFQSAGKYFPGWHHNGKHSLVRDVPRQKVKKVKEQGVAENFADGKNPQDKGDSKRHGINTKAGVSSLRKTAKQGGRKGQLAHWLANMKAGRAKKNK